MTPTALPILTLVAGTVASAHRARAARTARAAAPGMDATLEPLRLQPSQPGRPTFRR